MKNSEYKWKLYLYGVKSQKKEPFMIGDTERLEYEMLLEDGNDFAEKVNFPPQFIPITREDFDLLDKLREEFFSKCDEYLKEKLQLPFVRIRDYRMKCIGTTNSII